MDRSRAEDEARDEERAVHYDKKKRRRGNQLNPDQFKISEVTRPIPRHDAKKVVPKLNEVFNFHCEGDIHGRDNSEGRHVEWKATFDRPIEQMIYPSLQRFNNDAYEERRKAHIALHGTQDALSVGHQAHSSGNSDIKIELLPDTEQSLDNKLMYLHTPKWIVNVSPCKGSPRQRGPSPSRSILEEIDVDGEVFLRQQIKAKHHDFVEQQAREKKELELLSSPFHSLSIEKRKSRFGHQLAPLADSGEHMYGTLVGRSTRSPSGRSKHRVVQKLTELTASESAHQEQSKFVREHVPADQQHMQNGLLYFRVRNALNTARMQEIETLNQRSMTFTHKRMTRKSSNAFSLRVSALRDASTTTGETKVAGTAPNISEMHALRNEDHVMVTAQDLRDLPEIHELNLSRLNRAVANQLSGFDAALMARRSAGGSAGVAPGSADAAGAADGFVSASARRELALRAELNKREAQDRLLLHQLDAGLLPETFIKSQSEAESLTINLSKYGIGDARGLCLGKCLAGLDRLESLGLSDNRLTAASLPAIIRNAHHASLLHLDLSFNFMHDQGAKAIAQHFRNAGNALKYLDLCNCDLECSDVHTICTNLKVYSNVLEVLLLSSNKIQGLGAAELCMYLSSPLCRLGMLDLSWNTAGDVGAIEFAQALPQNKSLTKLNLAANAINDHGGQRLADSLSFHSALQDVNLSQNNIADRTCFVVSQVLRNHPSMRKLDLSLNPLGEAGARSIFRSILRGLQCFVTMRNCSYGDDATIYKHTYPTSDNPYSLDLSEPYSRAVVQELLFKYQDDPAHCGFEGLVFREQPKAPETSLQLAVTEAPEARGRHSRPAQSLASRVCLRGSSEPWVVPRSGVLRFSFAQAVFVPTTENKIGDAALNILQLIVENGVTANDKKMWLQLICQDVYFTTEQAQGMIQRFKKKRTIGSGELTVLDLLKSLWKYLLDTENMFDFLVAYADPEQRKDLVYALTLKRYRFNWANPTGHWTLSLADKAQRSIMMQIIAINNSESEFSRTQSGRQDTSQQGNWYNFRNTLFTADGVTREISIDKEFLKSLPAAGTLDFDYVSTSRLVAAAPEEDAGGDDDGDEDDDEEEGGGGGGSGVGDDDDDDSSLASRPAKPAPTSRAASRGAGMRASMSGRHGSVSKRLASRTAGTSRSGPRVITDDELYVFLKKLGLSNRSKLASANAVFVLMDLQLASTKYLFTTAQINLLLDSFQDTWDIQSKVIVAMFSRIRDLHNLDVVLRNLHANAQQDIMRRLGCLNVVNPLKPAFDYVFPLNYLDNRVLVVTLMELASIESADQLQEEPSSELPLASLYGSYTRALNEVRSEVMRLSFADFGARTNNISWVTRRDLLKKFLVGTQPLDEDMFRIISLFKEMEAANALTRGPIDLQYATYLKTIKGTQGRTTKTTKSLVNAMRGISSTRKSIV